MALNIENIVAELKEATILELNDLVKAIEEEFGVSAAAPVAVAAGYLFHKNCFCALCNISST